MARRINNRYDIDIASSLFCDITICINTTQINRKWLCNAFIRCIAFNFNNNIVLINNLCILCKG